jgi:hypothetical protein
LKPEYRRRTGIVVTAPLIACKPFNGNPLFRQPNSVGCRIPFRAGDDRDTK